jgi:hypothetical protein
VYTALDLNQFGHFSSCAFLRANGAASGQQGAHRHIPKRQSAHSWTFPMDKRCARCAYRLIEDPRSKIADHGERRRGSCPPLYACRRKLATSPLRPRFTRGCGVKQEMAGMESSVPFCDHDCKAGSWEKYDAVGKTAGSWPPGATPGVWAWPLPSDSAAAN